MPDSSASDLPIKVQQVMACLAASGVDSRLHMSTTAAKTAVLAAEVLGVSVGQIANSLIFQDEVSGELVLIVASGAHRVDLALIHEQTGRRLVKAAGKDIKAKVGYAIGGVPPVAHLSALVTFLDEALLQYETVWAAAGVAESMCSLPPKSLPLLTQGRWVRVAEPATTR
ncbi:MAG: YbaK/EbsC family protein [Neisseriaceae bacterium]|nr:YbaK/EbsC family protein [Neisseriaceae bacterium]